MDNVYVLRVTVHCSALYCTVLYCTVLIVCNVRSQDGLSAGLSHDGGVGMFQSGSAPYRSIFLLS